MDTHIKKDFPLFEHNPGLVYLDSAATAQTPFAVLDRVREFETTSRANVHRGIYDLSERATKAYEDARARVARHIGAGSPDEVVFTKNTTESINMIAYSLAGTILKKGDRILISRAEHHSNFLPWQMLRDTYGIILDIVNPEADGSLSLDAVAAALRPQTKLAAFSHVSHVLGSVYPIAELGALLRSKGILFLVDGAQAVAHMSVHVESLNCDFYAFSGHKMGGPMGIGVLYIRKEIGAALDPFMRGGGMIEEVREEQSAWAPLPHRFEPGTPNVTGAIGLAAACEYIERIGYNQIHSIELELMEHITEFFSRTPHVRIYGPRDSGARSSVISFSIDGVHPHDLATILSRDRIAIRAGHHCAMPLMEYLGMPALSRVSLWLYNDTDDVWRFSQGIEKAIHILSS